MQKISIILNNNRLTAELYDTPTAEKILASLPVEARAQVWGKEIYFSTPVNTGNEPDARETVEIGDLAYWPPGNAFCIFFGPTPASIDDEPRAASDVNVFGRLLDDIAPLHKVRQGDPVRIELISADA